MEADGIDLYERGGNIALSNLFYYGWSTAFGEEKFHILLEKFISALRTRDKRIYEDYISTLKNYTNESSRHDMAKWLASFILNSDDKHGYDGLIGTLPDDVLDVSLDFLIDTACAWRGIYGTQAELEIIHDTSSNMAKKERTWKAFFDEKAPAALVGYDRRVRNFPISVKHVKFATEQDYIGLQLADIFAGALAHGARWLFVHRDPLDTYGERIGQLISGKCEELGVDGIFPINDFTPESLDTVGAKYIDPHLYTAFILRGK